MNNGNDEAVTFWLTLLVTSNGQKYMHNLQTFSQKFCQLLSRLFCWFGQNPAAKKKFNSINSVMFLQLFEMTVST
jgi:hypothetical protein